MLRIKRSFAKIILGSVIVVLITAVIGWAGAPAERVSVDKAGALLPPLVCSGGKPNGICDKEEQDKGACPEDCGGGSDGGGDSGSSASCDNDNVCEPENGEATFNCGDCPSVCGDAICTADEVDSCLDDCPIDVTCGDGLCSAFENEELCAADCTGEEEPAQPANQPPPIPTITPTPGEDDPGASGAGELTPEMIETPDDVLPAGVVDEDTNRPDKQGDSGQDFDAASPYLTPGENRGTFILIGLLAVALIVIVVFVLVGGAGFMRLKYAGLTRPPGSADQMGGSGNDVTPVQGSGDDVSFDGLDGES